LDGEEDNRRVVVGVNPPPPADRFDSACFVDNSLFEFTAAAINPFEELSAWVMDRGDGSDTSPLEETTEADSWESVGSAQRFVILVFSLARKDSDDDGDKSLVIPNDTVSASPSANGSLQTLEWLVGDSAVFSCASTPPPPTEFEEAAAADSSLHSFRPSRDISNGVVDICLVESSSEEHRVALVLTRCDGTNATDDDFSGVEDKPTRCSFFIFGAMTCEDNTVTLSGGDAFNFKHFLLLSDDKDADDGWSFLTCFFTCGVLGCGDDKPI
jgi:hypothetical protein